jgi:hypothetical protein
MLEVRERKEKSFKYCFKQMVEERESCLYFNNAKGTTFGSLDEGNQKWFPWCFYSLGNT